MSRLLKMEQRLDGFLKSEEAPSVARKATVCLRYINFVDAENFLSYQLHDVQVDLMDGQYAIKSLNGYTLNPPATGQFEFYPNGGDELYRVLNTNTYSTNGTVFENTDTFVAEKSYEITFLKPTDNTDGQTWKKYFLARLRAVWMASSGSRV